MVFGHEGALDEAPDLRACVAVLDVGKTNIKFSAVTKQGDVREVLSTPNLVVRGEPWHYHDLVNLSEWVFTTLAVLCRRHPIEVVVPTGHGAAGVLVNDNPDELFALPQIDYEQNMPEDINARYAALSGSFFDRGSALMGQAAHHARQLYWMACHAPDVVAKARWFLSVPQYWTWRLCGVAASERSCLGSQSHLWNIVERCWTPIVHQYGWEEKLPPLRYAWERLGYIRPELQRQYNLPSHLAVLTGGHDSSLNLYRYHAAGMPDVRLISSGTWSVGMCAATKLERIDERRSMVINSDLEGGIVGGIIAMGGREFSRIAQNVDADVRASTQVIDDLIARGSFALPSFCDSDGPFVGSSGRGYFHGPALQNAAERLSMAVLYTALVSVALLDALGDSGDIVLDGTALRDPLYGIIIAALCPTSEVLCNYGSHGIAGGAALLATHKERQMPIPLKLDAPVAYAGNISALRLYAQEWQRCAFRAAFEKCETDLGLKVAEKQRMRAE